MSIEQQIEELRAELHSCRTRREMRQIASELQAAQQERERVEKAFDAAIR